MISESFIRGILLKVAFKPEPLRRAQAALIYAALAGHEFTGDVLTKEIVGEDNTLAGCAVGSLATMQMIHRVGRCKSPSKSRNGAWTNTWRLADGRANTAKAWLRKNGFQVEEPKSDWSGFLFNPREFDQELAK